MLTIDDCRAVRGSRRARVGVTLFCLAGMLASARADVDPAANAAQELLASKIQARMEAENAEDAAYIDVHSDREDLVKVPMRDGVNLNATVLFPKGAPRKGLPTILLHNPYNTDTHIIPGFGGYLRSLLGSGYAIVILSTRGRYFSEGSYTFLAGSGKDGYDALDWISRQPWSSGKVGTLGCSSSAEEQHKLNAMHHPALAAAVPMGSGAGIGRVGPYNEMGNFYRGGAIMNLWFAWYSEYGYTYRPEFPKDLSREDMQRIARLWALEPSRSPVGLNEAIGTLPLSNVLKSIGAAPSGLDDFVSRMPNDPRWRQVEFGGEGDRAAAPVLYVNSWYDVSIGPNTAMFEYQVKNAATAAAREQSRMIVAPTLHCVMGRVESEHTVVGRRDVGDARFDYVGFVQRWFDHWVKGVDNGITKAPRVQAYAMGANRWRSYDAWPPRESRSVTYYLDSDGGANSREGNGRLVATRPGTPARDSFAYDPLQPVPTVGGGICCFAGVEGGAFDQATVEQRKDVLVYTSAPLAESLEVTGPIQVSLYLSSDVKDTDLMVKLVDVYPDGRAYNLDQSVQRVRWREGYEQPVFMTPGQVYKVELPPLVTSNSFGAGHRIRIQVSSSSFPHFERNLNTGGSNFDEKDPVVANNVIHHSPEHPSQIVLPVVGGRVAPDRLSRGSSSPR